ncbi:hypothetical protein FHX10_003362 [Rhizobium sp. BK591]|uniref:hypothetical protein n=1 Tax=Rhizobium sp. BK591 TaxID=2586985 RepID=UPI0016095761|nr:hypothetical protein [Rhizobium sp. BK591]MBB3743863.1 hypothetical protein [Rhizobium sp. BK591]
MTTSSSTLRNMLFEALDLLDSVQDQLVSLDRMEVERLKENSGWGKQPNARTADYRGEVPALQSALVQGVRLNG